MWRYDYIFLTFKNDSSLTALHILYSLCLHLYSPLLNSHFRRNRETIYWANVKFHNRLPLRNFSYYTKLLWVKWYKGLIHINEILLIKNNMHLQHEFSLFNKGMLFNLKISIFRLYLPTLNNLNFHVT